MDLKETVQGTVRHTRKIEILQAALKAYSAYGIAETTTRQIAEIAGIGKSTIYEYFKNKDELLNASFHYLMAGMIESHRTIHEIAQQDPVCALNSYLDSAIKMSLSEPSTLLLISQYSLSILLKTDQFETAKNEYSKKMYPIMQSLTDEFRFIISSGIEKKMFHLAIDLEIEGLVYTICALIREIQAQAFLQNKDDLAKTCIVIKNTIFELLGIKNTPEH